MNYLKEIVAFESWVELPPLPPNARVLWYQLMFIANKLCWQKEWFQIDNRRLMFHLSIDSEHTFLRARDKLIESGIIEYKKGKKGSPNSYRLISFLGKEENEEDKKHCNFYSKNDSKSDSINDSKNDSKSAVKTADINKHKYKQKQKQDLSIGHFANDPESDEVQPSMAKASKAKATKGAEASPYSKAFETFWALYPRKVNKQKAHEVFKKLNPAESLLGVMLTSLKQQRQSEQWQTMQFIPHATTWLNGRRWEDELEPARSQRQQRTQAPSNRFVNSTGVRDFSDLVEG